jgi:hypothetical protein
MTVFHLNFFSLRIALIPGSAFIEPSYWFFTWYRLSLIASQWEYFQINSRAKSKMDSRFSSLTDEIWWRMTFDCTFPLIYRLLVSILKMTSPWIELASFFVKSVMCFITSIWRSEPSSETSISLLIGAKLSLVVYSSLSRYFWILAL